MRILLCSRSALVLAALVGLAGATPAGAQQRGILTGRVTDAQSGRPLSAVQVYLVGAGMGVLTQQNGRYLLQNVPPGTHTLTAQRVGYRTVSENVTVVEGQTLVHDFQIAEQALQLDEVIVTGTPGGTQRRAIGNVVAQVDAAAITQRAAIANVQELLAAKAPGLDFTRLTGNIGAGSQIEIRGVSSLQLGAQPLIYIDGVRVDNSANLGPALGRSAGEATALGSINPQNIASVEIIKGPAAATLYGTEASAGVIQIITKKGESGAPEFNLMVREGANFMIDPGGKLGMKYGCQPTPDNPSGFGPCAPENLRPYDPYAEANEWARAHDVGGGDLFGYGPSRTYNLSVRGGTDQVRYFLSGNYTSDTGIIPWNWDESMNLRGNVSVLFSEDLTLDVSTGYTQGETRFAVPVPGDGGVWHEMVWGSWNPGDRELDVFQEHFPQNIRDVKALRGYNRFTGSMTARYSSGDWLTQRLIVGLDKGWDTNSRLIPLDPEGRFTENATGEIYYARPITTNTTVDYTASADYQLNEALGFTTSIGAQYYTRAFEELENTGREFGSSLQTTINQTAVDQLTLGFSSIENKSLGFYVQERVGWNDRLFLTAAMRADDNSAFGSEFDLVYYPKFSGTWVISEESFWNLALVNSLRLRTAWGEAGRQPSTFAGVDIYTSFPGPGGAPGITPQSPGNELVGPERSSELEVGFDIALFEDRLSGNFTYYTRTTTDALVSRDLAPSLGFPGAVDTNLGRLDSWGWEAALDARLLQTDNLALDLALSGDHTDNMLVSLGEGILESGNFQVGLPYPNIVGPYLLSADLVAPGQYANPMCDSGTGPHGNLPGGEPVPCEEVAGLELLYGPAFPTYTWSIAPTLTLFNSLRLFALAEGEYGRWQANIDTEYAHRYRNTRASRLQNDPLYLAAAPSAVDDERYYGRVPADFWKLRVVGARYQLPESLVRLGGVERASIAFSARNIWMIWQKSETDLGGGVIYDIEDAGPTTDASNVALWTMPSISRMDVTLRVTF